MEFVSLSIIVLFCALQSVTKKAFDEKTGGGTYLFAAISAFAAMLFFVCTLKGFSFDRAFVLYSLGFGASYFASLVFSYLSIITGPASISSLISSYSLIMPAVYGLIFLNESIGKMLIPGMLCLMVSLFLINGKSDKDAVKASPKWGLYVFVSFLGGGMCSVTQKMQQIAFDGAYKNEFMIVALLFVVAGSLCMFLFNERKECMTATYIKQGWLWGGTCGVMNGAVNLLVMILSARMNASVMFPIISAGSLIITYILFRILYKEKLSKTQMVGFVLGTVSIVLLNL